MNDRRKLGTLVTMSIVMMGFAAGCSDNTSKTQTTLQTNVTTNATAIQQLTLEQTQALDLLRAKALGFQLNGQTNEVLTRGQFVEMLLKALQIRPNSSSLSSFSPFKDVTKTNEYTPYIEWATKHGWINQSNYPDFEFHPNDPVTKEFAVAMLSHTMFGNNIGTVSGVKYTDENQINTKYVNAINLMTKMGVLTIASNQQFNPKEQLTQADAVHLILHVLSVQANWVARSQVLQNRPLTAQYMAIGSYKLAQNPESNAIIGASQIEQGKWQDAITSYQDAIADGNKNPYVYSGIAIAYTELKDYSSAINVQEKAIQANPKDPMQELILSMIYYQAGDMQKSEAAYSKAQTIDPNANPASMFKTTSEQPGMASFQPLGYSPSHMINEIQDTGFSIKNFWSKYHETIVSDVSIALSVASVVTPPPFDTVAIAGDLAVNTYIAGSQWAKAVQTGNPSDIIKAEIDTAFVILPAAGKVEEIARATAVKKLDFVYRYTGAIKRIYPANIRVGLQSARVGHMLDVQQELNEEVEIIDHTIDVGHIDYEALTRMYDNGEENIRDAGIEMPQTSPSSLNDVTLTQNDMNGGSLYSSDKGPYTDPGTVNNPANANTDANTPDSQLYNQFIKAIMPQLLQNPTIRNALFSKQGVHGTQSIGIIGNQPVNNEWKITYSIDNQYHFLIIVNATTYKIESVTQQTGSP